MDFHVYRTSKRRKGHRDFPPCEGLTFHPFPDYTDPDTGYWLVSLETMADLMAFCGVAYEEVIISTHRSWDFLPASVVGSLEIYDDWRE